MDKEKSVKAGFGIMVLRDDKVLLGLRNEDPAKADSELSGEGTWTFPGGGMDYGETFESGVLRELEEETGLKSKTAEVFCVENSIGPNAQFITIGLKTENVEGEVETREPNEIVEWKWFSLDDLPENIFPPSKYMIDCHLNNKFYIKND